MGSLGLLARGIQRCDTKIVEGLRAFFAKRHGRSTWCG